MQNPGFDDVMLAAAETLAQCDAYIVLAVDSWTGEVHAQGPFDGLAATVAADRLRRELDADGLSDIMVSVVRMHHST